jgi:ubiquitin C-terminal hydrolase
MGSTCFINAVLQALFHCTVFTNWLNSKEDGYLPLKMQLKKLDSSSTTTDVLIQYAQLYSIFKDKIELIKNSTLGTQEDAQEFLVCLLDQLITENIISRIMDKNFEALMQIINNTNRERIDLEKLYMFKSKCSLKCNSNHE